MESLWEELTIFAQRTLFSPENQYALEQLKPPGLMKRLWRLLFGGQPKAVPDSSRWTAIFKDPETQKIYEVDVTKMYVSGI
ncbi:MAG: hypothetical protein KGI60_03495 [Patescibacteria group bacterium]|nr:hypothetical protein [Patescibacteria group bacterium]